VENQTGEEKLELYPESPLPYNASGHPRRHDLSRLRVRFVINQGRHGAPLAKLGRIAEQTEKFLRALAADNGVAVHPGEWLAADFKNSSVEYQAEYPGEVSPAVAQLFSIGLETLADYDPTSEGLNGRVSDTTALEYARIGTLIDPDEIIRMGIISPSASKPKWRDITYSRLSSIRREMEQPIASHGAVQGIIHSWFKEAREPHFTLRELSSDDFVKVHYPSVMYDQVAKAVQERTTTLMVSGLLSYDRVTRKATELKADRIEKMTMLSTEDFESLFGAVPEFEGSFLDDED
jgi:hypothetical protein